MNSSFQIHPRVIQVIQKQITELVKKPLDSIHYVLNESDILDIQADIHGPVGTPYSGGVFRCKLVLSSEFPQVPPKGFFLTKIFHPNVSEKGEICVNTLKKDWDPSNWSLQHILEIIRCLLIVPFPESALNEEAGKEFMEDYEEYSRHARLITELYAKPKGLAVEKSKGMDISCENSQEEKPTRFSPTTVNGDSQFNKEKDGGMAAFGAMFKSERADEPLMTVTNSLNTNLMMNQVEDNGFKKSEPTLGNVGFQGIGNIHIGTNLTANVASGSAKKENDKKIWKKRI